MRRSRVWACGLLVAAGSVACGLGVNPPAAGAGRGGPDAEQGAREPVRHGHSHGEAVVNVQQLSPELLRIRLSQRLASIRNQESKIERALSLLDAGEPVDSVLRAMRERRDGRGGEGGEQRAGGDAATSGGRGIGRQLSGVEREQLFDLLAIHVPELHERLIAVREENPAAAEAILSRVSGQLLEAVAAGPDDEIGRLKLAELRTSWRVMDVLRGLRSFGAEPVPEAAQQELVDAIAEQLAVKQALAEAELNGLRRRVSELETRAAAEFGDPTERARILAGAMARRAAEGRSQRDPRSKDSNGRD